MNFLDLKELIKECEKQGISDNSKILVSNSNYDINDIITYSIEKNNKENFINIHINDTMSRNSIDESVFYLTSVKINVNDNNPVKKRRCNIYY